MAARVDDREDGYGIGDARDPTRSQLRGSTLLLVGRIIALGLNFAVQVLTVRHLSKGEYGVFAYALSIATLAESIVLFGFDRAVPRYIPIYEEQGEPRRAAGVIVLLLGAIAGLGTATVVIVLGFAGPIAGELRDRPEMLTVLSILILLGPLQALDQLTIGLFAVFARPRAIFVRKYVLGPGLRVLVVVGLVVGDAGVVFLSVGYVAAGALGVAVYGGLLVRLMKERGLLSYLRPGRFEIAWREILSFTIPLLTTDLVFAAINSTDAIMLGRFGTAEDIASLRAVLPLARLNQVVLQAFGILYTPAASRLYARSDSAGIRDLYWSTATWVAVLSFPIFALTFGLARPLTVLLFSERYENAGVLLAVLSVGYYVQAALGPNGTTLGVYRRLRYLVVINLVALVANIGLNLLLIPPLGVLGAAIGTSATFVAHNLLKQAGLRLATGIGMFDRRYLRLYGTIAAAALALVITSVMLPTGALVGAVLAVTASLVVLLATRRSLQVDETFPEIARIPILGRFLRGGR